MSFDRNRPCAVLIAGPTASGKSRLALELAEAAGGVVVNADSMQVYEDLRILTARPSDEDLAAVPHRLYGHVAPAALYSVGAWARDVAVLLAELAAENRVPVVCGGTGLYFRALLGGLDDMPPVDPALRGHWRERIAAEGPQALHAVLAARDPEAARRIEPGDSQRIVRAIELGEATGLPLSASQNRQGRPLIDAGRSLKLVLTPPRAVLRDRIAARFDDMIERGAIEEAERFASLPGALEGPAGKAIGVSELNRHCRGEIALGEAVRLSVDRSRQYAKRQETWFRHQLDASWIRTGLASRDERKDLIDRVKRP